MWYWNTLFPTRKPADHDAYREALARSLREPGRMQALATMVSTGGELQIVEGPAIIPRPKYPIR
jgi:hypothetical protein